MLVLGIRCGVALGRLLAARGDGLACRLAWRVLRGIRGVSGH